MDKEAFWGFDPGPKSGAIACLYGNLVSVWDMPDHRWMEAMLPVRDTSICLIEKQQAFPKQGASSGFKLGENYGYIQGILLGLGVPFDIVAPREWKNAMGLGRIKDLKERKERSREMARRLFPQVAGELARIKDHGRAEALLLAEYLRRREHGR